MIQFVWIAGFLVGTTTHIIDLVSGGMNTYGEFPVPLRVFWISLTVLDPLTAMLVLLRKRAGVVLALAVILVDIAVNWTVFITVDDSPLIGVVDQTVFAAVLVVTAPVLWVWFGVERVRARPTA